MRAPLSQQERQELYGLWTKLLQAQTEDKSNVHPLLRLLLRRSIKLSEKTMGAVAKLLDRMATLHPERFGCDALRERCDGWVLQMAFSFLLAFLRRSFFRIHFPYWESLC